MGSGLHGFATQEFTNRGTLAREMLADVDNEDLAKAIAKQKEARDMKLPIDLGQAMDAPSNIDVYRNTLANTAQGKKWQQCCDNSPQILMSQWKTLCIDCQGIW